MKKRVAREIVIAGILFFLLLLTYFILAELKDNRNKNLKSLEGEQRELEIIEPFKRLWFDLKGKKRFNGTYDLFLSEYGTFDKNEVLFNLAKNNELYSGNLVDFQLEYYKNESALDYLYNMKELRSFEYEVFLDSIKTNDNFTKRCYEFFILDGYNGSFLDFKELMRKERELNKNFTYKRIENIKTEIETNKESQKDLKASFINDITDNLQKYLIWILLSFYGLRIIFYAFKWGLKNK